MRTQRRFQDRLQPTTLCVGMVILASSSVACQPETGAGLLARVQPQPNAPTPLTVSKRLQAAWQLVDTDLAHTDGMVTVRLEQIRRAVRLVAAPATVTARLPAETREVELFVAAPLADEAGEACEIKATIGWLSSGHVDAVTLGAEKAASATWHRLSLTTARPQGPTELHLAFEAGASCLPGATTVAVSEVVARASQAPPRENVLLVVIDTLRRDFMDCDEVSRAVTPNLYDRWCKHGTFFADVVTSAPWTYPAIASMLTGLPPRDHHGEGIDKNQHDIDRAVPTLAEVFRWNAFETHAVIANWQAGRGLWRGFDTFTEMHPYLGRGFAEERRANRVVDATIGRLRSGIREPFFLWVLFIDLHEPVDAALVDGRPPAECAGVTPLPTRWEGLGRLTPPLSAETERRLACRRALYRASLTFIDRHLGRLAGRLDRLGVAGRTSVIVASDHGEEMWEHGAEQIAAGEKSRDTWGVGHGHTLYQELLRVPLLVAPAASSGKERGANTEPALVAVTDIFATALGLAGIEAPATSRSRDLLRRGADLTRPVVSESVAYGPERLSVTTPALTVIGTGPERVVVFDRAKDPRELTPESPTSPLYLEGRRLLREATATPRTAAALTAADQAALQALGYQR